MLQHRYTVLCTHACGRGRQSHIYNLLITFFKVRTIESEKHKIKFGVALIGQPAIEERGKV